MSQAYVPSAARPPRSALEIIIGFSIWSVISVIYIFLTVLLGSLLLWGGIGFRLPFLNILKAMLS